jgi:hypothetical protein
VSFTLALAWFIAGWSSPVARQAHNLKVVSSNLAPATKYQISPFVRGGAFFNRPVPDLINRLACCLFREYLVWAFQETGCWPNLTAHPLPEPLSLLLSRAF